MKRVWEPTSNKLPISTYPLPHSVNVVITSGGGDWDDVEVGGGSDVEGGGNEGMNLSEDDCCVNKRVCNQNGHDLPITLPREHSDI